MTYNRGRIEDPDAFAQQNGAASWLYLCGEEFASMEGGMSYAQVEAAVPESAQVVSDPPVVPDMDLARQQIAALEALPRPALVTCRMGPRSSALVYLYAGLKDHSSADDVLRQAEEDGAPFAESDELKAWVRQGLDELA
ncbi:MAG: Beta-lactamase hydrolase-like protein phosphatase-like domain [Thermoleophilaceae bacterium]|nr:Beta-lactamase hydrolase-like protein phosphatase-like domain [Thermoleophilaceae bacterium]